jgi:hypothetical protein
MPTFSNMAMEEHIHIETKKEEEKTVPDEWNEYLRSNAERLNTN